MAAHGKALDAQELATEARASPEGGRFEGDVLEEQSTAAPSATWHRLAATASWLRSRNTCTLSGERSSPTHSPET